MLLNHQSHSRQSTTRETALNFSAMELTVVDPAHPRTALIDHRRSLVVPLASRPACALALAPRSSEYWRRPTSFYVYKGRARP